MRWEGRERAESERRAGDLDRQCMLHQTVKVVFGELVQNPTKDMLVLVDDGLDGQEERGSGLRWAGPTQRGSAVVCVCELCSMFVVVTTF
jgi:hypothetical protein